MANAEELFQEDHRIRGRREISDDENYGHEDSDDEPQERMTANQLREFLKFDKTTEEKLSKIPR